MGHILHAAILLLPLAAATEVPTGGRTPEDCTVGSQWTTNFIRFECYTGSGVKGVRPIGCVPANTDAGAIIAAGAQHNETYFTYSCSQSGADFSYEIINCRDPTGAALAVGVTRTLPDGSVWKCYRNATTNSVMLSQEKEGGCVQNGTVYAKGQTFNTATNFTAVLAGNSTLLGTGVRFACSQSAAGAYVSTPNGCVLPSGAVIVNNQYSITGSTYVQCLIAANGTVTMRVVQPEEITCPFDGKTYQTGQQFNSTDGKFVLTCSYKVVSSVGCLFNGRGFGYNTFTFFNGSYYFCTRGSGAINVGNLTGCPYNGTVVGIAKTVAAGNVVLQCGYTLNGSVPNGTVLTPIGCYYKGVTLAQNQIYDKDGERKQCVLQNSTWTLINVTTDGSSSVIGGNGGAGSGGNVNLTTTGAPKTTTTTTKTASATTTVKPTTAGPTEPAPSNPSTAAPTESPVTDSVKTTSGDAETEKPTTALATRAPGQCADAFSFCSQLEPVCTVNHTSSLSNLRDLVKTANVTVEQLREVLTALGIDEPITESEQQEREVEEVVLGVAGLQSGGDCGCEDEECASRCLRRRATSCEKCEIFKRKLHDLVLMVCPSTCNSCEKADKVPLIIKTLIRFYTHDCN